MRSYVVGAGDSPASIAAAFAGCPKCAADLVDCNPQKSARTMPNGFRTFSDLYVGETLALPDKWFDGTLDRLPQKYFDKLPSHTGVGAPPATSLGLGLVVPVPSISTTANFVTSAISVAKCHQVLMTVFPIPQGIIGSDPAAVLKDLGFTASVSTSPTGGTYVNATYTGAVTYTSNQADAENVLVYTTEGYPWAGTTVNAWAVGETITGSSSGVTAQIAAVNDDTPPDGNGYLQLTNPSGQFTFGETITGSQSGNTATAIAYGAVMSSQSGLLGVTNFVDAGVVANCQPSPPGAPCAAGMVKDLATGVCTKPCPGGYPPTSGACAPFNPGGGVPPGGGGGPTKPPPSTGQSFTYVQGHRIQSVASVAAGGSLPSSVAGETVASVQAQFDSAAAGAFKVVSVSITGQSATVIADYCGATKSLPEPSTGNSSEGTPLTFTHADLGASPPGTSCGAAPGTPTPPSSSSSATTTAVVGGGLALALLGGLWVAFR